MKQIIYEQPLNELIRVSLRLEHIFEQLNNLANQINLLQNPQIVIRLMIDAVNILDRPDYKTKLTKEFERYIMVLSRLHNDDKVNQETLNSTLSQLKQHKNYFIETQGKIAQKLRTNDFLTEIRKSQLIPGGDSCIDTPAYHYWLNQPHKNQQQQINLWLNELKNIYEAITLLLSIIRKTAKPQENIAEKGFYHESLDSQLPFQLIRVALPKTTQLYPEISAGRHRFTIRFMTPDIITHPKQTDQNIKFTLTKCIL